ncbi:MAG: PAS domain S-box protein, partial [Syntrophomonas sp.]
MEQKLREATERNKTILQRNAQLIALLDSIPFDVWQTDNEGIFVGVNRSCARNCGLEVNQMVGQSLFDVFPRDIAEKYWNDTLKVIKSKQPETCELMLTLEGLGSFWVSYFAGPILDQTGNVIGITGMIRDINERKLAQEALKDREELYHCLLTQSSDGIVIIDAGNGEILEVNDRFLTMLGYSKIDVHELNITNLCLDKRDLLFRAAPQSLKHTHLPPEINRMARKNGDIIDVELVASLVHYSDQQVVMLNIRDITKQKRIQESLNRNVLLAGNVQRGLLPSDIKNRMVKINTIFEPYNLVSGDFYDYIWNYEQTKLFGFILDVSGHGLATALETTTIKVLFDEIAHQDMTIAEKLSWVNKQSMRYFADTSFAGAICFEMDFNEKTMTYASGGINYFMTCSRELNGVIKVPGAFIGLSREVDFEQHTIPIQNGDTFYFMSDGIYDQITAEDQINIANFDNMVDKLRKLARSDKRWDDASAVCFRIKGLNKYPQKFHVSSFEQYKLIRPRISRLILELPVNGDMLE